MRENLESSLGEELSTEAERDTINQALSQASDWLDDEGWDATAEVSKIIVRSNERGWPYGVGITLLFCLPCLSGGETE